MLKIAALQRWTWQGKRRWLTLAALTLLLFKAAPYVIPGTPLAQHYPSSISVFDANGHLLRLTLAADDKYRLWLPLDAISPQIKEAVLLHEDRFFYVHLGINPIASARALWQTGTGPRRIGGSTISMQVARMHYRINSRNVAGKLQQMLRALQLELRYSKDEIFEAYLNLVPYGRNVEGVGAASQIYFAKRAQEVTLAQHFRRAGFRPGSERGAEFRGNPGM